MRIEVESSEGFGGESYEGLFKRIVQDLGIYRNVDEARMIMRPDIPFFLVSVRMRSPSSTSSIGEATELRDAPEGARLTILDENFAPAILRWLWDAYGRDRTDQLSRLELVVKGVKADELRDVEIQSMERQKSQLLDALWRILPEGFKVRHNLTNRSTITLMTTEACMSREWIELAEKVHEEMSNDV